MITNGFTYVAFLVFQAAVLIALKRTTKWKFFNYVPPIVLIYVTNMIFCTINFWDLEATSAAYGSTKNNLLYAMLFIMLLRCDFRKLFKLGPRMLGIFLSGSVTIMIGCVVAFVMFKGALGVESWRAIGTLCGSWIGGSPNMATLQDALAAPSGDYACALIVDTIYFAVWLALMLLVVPFAAKFNKFTNADTSKLDEVAARANAEIADDTRKVDPESMVILLGLSLMASALCQFIGPKLTFGIMEDSTAVTLLATAVGLVAALSPIGKMGGVDEMSDMYLYTVIALLASRAGINELLDAPLWVVAGGVILLVHALLMVVLSKLFRFDLCMVCTASQANVAGSASAPIVAAAHNPSFVGIGVLMGIFGGAVGNPLGLICAKVMQFFA